MSFWVPKKVSYHFRKGDDGMRSKVFLETDKKSRNKFENTRLVPLQQ